MYRLLRSNNSNNGCYWDYCRLTNPAAPTTASAAATATSTRPPTITITYMMQLLIMITMAAMIIAAPTRESRRKRERSDTNRTRRGSHLSTTEGKAAKRPASCVSASRNSLIFFPATSAENPRPGVPTDQHTSANHQADIKIKFSGSKQRLNCPARSGSGATRYHIGAHLYFLCGMSILL